MSFVYSAKITSPVLVVGIESGMTGSSSSSPYAGGDTQKNWAMLGLYLIAQCSPNTCKNSMGRFSLNEAPWFRLSSSELLPLNLGSCLGASLVVGGDPLPQPLLLGS